MNEVALLDLLDAIYQRSGTEEAWIAALARAADRLTGFGLGAVAYSYRVLSPKKAVLRAGAGHGTAVPRAEPILRETVEGMSEGMVRTASTLAVGVFSETGAFQDPVLANYAGRFQAHDVVMLNFGRREDGLGCMLAIHTPEERRPIAALRRLLARLGAHLALGLDLRFGPERELWGQLTARGGSNVGLACLSRREREVAARLAAGQRQKEVAFDLGLADSTVRVLASRAMAKLGVRTSRELIASLAPAPEEGAPPPVLTKM